MTFIRKHFILLSAVILFALYFFTRLYNILGLPIFTDEAIYIRWAQIALNDADWLFISLTDGKQPLFVWLNLIFLKFIEEPLLAGRLVSVFAGFLSLIGIYFITKELFNNSKIALLSALLYIIFPYALVYDRIALYDSLVAVFIIWSLYLEILLVGKQKLIHAVLLGLIIGCGLLTKSSAQFALILMPFSLILFNFKQKLYKPKLFRIITLFIVSAVISFTIYNILRLSPFFYIVEQKNHLFIFTFNEWIRAPFAVFLNNMMVFIEWIIGYTTIPFLTLVIAALFFKSKYTPKLLLLIIWFIIPIISTAFFGRLVYPRFLFFMLVPLIPAASFTLYNLIIASCGIFLKTAVFLIFIIFLAIKDFYIINDFKNAPIPKADKGQFIAGWPSGIGVNETIKFLEKESKNKKIFIGTQGTFGLMPYALEIYLHNNPNIIIKGYYPVNKIPPDEVINYAKKMPVYFVYYQECPDCKNIGIAPQNWPVDPVIQIEKPEKNVFYSLYRIK